MAFKIYEKNILVFLEQLRKDLSQMHSNKFEEKERTHTKELAALRLQLDRALEITKIKVD